MRKNLNYLIIFLIGFGLCALIWRESGVVGNLLPGATARGREDLSKALDQKPVTQAPVGSLVGTNSVADAAAKVEPAVVNIDIIGRRIAPDVMMGPFGIPRGGVEEFQGAGSGIILSGDGYIVTNNHVVEPIAGQGGGNITITLDNGKQFHNVRIVGRDPRTDLAVLKIAGVRDLPAASLGDSDKLRVGDWAIAVGNPLNFNSTVTLGIISALNRRNFHGENDSLDRVIQTDAAINPGNSGGALANIQGQVIGINTAIASSTGASVGIGFAIPINSARRIIKELVETGHVVRPYLGISYVPLAAVNRAGLGQDFPTLALPNDNKGVCIYSQNPMMPAIIPGSPAQKAGLRLFDVIRGVDNKPVDEATNTLSEIVKSHKVGDRLPLTIWRSGATQQVMVTLETMPSNYGQPKIEQSEESGQGDMPQILPGR